MHLSLALLLYTKNILAEAHKMRCFFMSRTFEILPRLLWVFCNFRWSFCKEQYCTDVCYRSVLNLLYENLVYVFALYWLSPFGWLLCILCWNLILTKINDEFNIFTTFQSKNSTKTVCRSEGEKNIVNSTVAQQPTLLRLILWQLFSFFSQWLEFPILFRVRRVFRTWGNARFLTGTL